MLLGREHFPECREFPENWHRCKLFLFLILLVCQPWHASNRGRNDTWVFKYTVCPVYVMLSFSSKQLSGMHGQLMKSNSSDVGLEIDTIHGMSSSLQLYHQYCIVLYPCEKDTCFRPQAHFGVYRMHCHSLCVWLCHVPCPCHVLGHDVAHAPSLCPCGVAGSLPDVQWVSSQSWECSAPLSYVGAWCPTRGHPRDLQACKNIRYTKSNNLQLEVKSPVNTEHSIVGKKPGGSGGFSYSIPCTGIKRHISQNNLDQGNQT